MGRLNQLVIQLTDGQMMRILSIARRRNVSPGTIGQEIMTLGLVAASGAAEVPGSGGSGRCQPPHPPGAAGSGGDSGDKSGR